MEFEDEAKWNYYINEDPGHQAYKAGLKDVVERVGTFDFQAGKF